LVKIYDLQEDYFEAYKESYNHFVNQTRSSDIEYKLVFLQAADPFAEDFSAAKIIEQEWEEPRLKNLRKDEFSSVTVLA
jgi:hypothetical protein